MRRGAALSENSPPRRASSAKMVRRGTPGNPADAGALVVEEFAYSHAQRAYQAEVGNRAPELIPRKPKPGEPAPTPGERGEVFYKDATPKADHFMQFRVRLPRALRATVSSDVVLDLTLCFAPNHDTDEYVVVADQANDRLQVFDVPTKAAVCAFGRKGRKAADFDTPGYVAIDREDRVFVTDILNHRVQMLLFNPKSKSLWHVRTIGGRGVGPGQFQFPRGLCLTERGELIVCDTGNGRVQVLDVNNNFRFVRCLEAPDSMAPLDAAVNREGEVLVSDTSNRIHIFDGEGAYSRSFGKKGTKDGMFNYPISICVDDMNMLFVCDQGNRRMQILSASDGSFKHKWSGWKKQAEGEGEEGCIPQRLCLQS